MTLVPGLKLGPYEIVAPLGAGGMGEVYRARDTRLDRVVAIKVLPSHVADAPEFRDRFEREARTVAALNHPHICALYDVGTHEEAAFLVMEYLEGETLEARLKRGTLPLEQALEIAVQVADALATAHRAGVVHRDLKPGNIMLVRRGGSGAPVAKLLDFGLAKAGVPLGTAAGGSMLPTTPPALTVQGTILGTYQYMAPEQLEGQDADARTDIFAFGAVLYEMIAGRKAFEAKSHAGLIAAILEHQPPSLSTIQSQVPAHLERILARCLAKSAEDRWQTAADLHRELKWVTGSGTVAVAPHAPPARTAPWQRSIHPGIAVACALLLATISGIVVWSVARAPAVTANRVARLTMVLGPGEALASLNNPSIAVSPLGTHVAYVTRSGTSETLHLRAIDAIEGKAIAGTDGASNPFFSPDGQWVGFFAQGRLQKASVSAGTIQTLCDAPFPRGGTWAGDGTIYFAPTNTSGLFKVPSTGGTPVEVTRLDRGRGEVSHRWPHVLPDGRGLMFDAWTGPGHDEAQVHIHRFDSGQRTVVIRGGETGRYVPTGHVVYSRADQLFAVPFDLGRTQVTGDAVRLPDTIWTGGEGSQYATADAGVLVYIPGHPQRFQRRLVWMSRDGNTEALLAPPRAYYNTSIAPDGRRAAVNLETNREEIWIYDFARATLTPLTTGDGSSQVPRWTPNGEYIVYRGTRLGFRNLWWKRIDDPADEERLTTGGLIDTPGSWSADGQWLLYSSSDQTGPDVWALPASGDRKPRVVVRTPFSEQFPTISPDGRWVAYTSDESGRIDVFVQPFMGPGRRVQISTDGGTEPVWALDGRELFYIDGDRMMAVDIQSTPTFAAGTPRILFESRFVLSPNGAAGYDVASDGRFLLPQPLHPDPPANQIHVVLNWFDELRRLTTAN